MIEKVKISLKRRISPIVERPMSSMILCGGTTCEIEHGIRGSMGGSMCSSNWLENLRKLCQSDKHQAKYWFWDNFKWNRHSLWIGKFNKMNHLPDSEDKIKLFLNKIVDDLQRSSSLKSKIYVKIYFSRNITTREPDINYLLVCDTPQLPNEFESTFLGVMCEKYQLTESLINRNPTFKNLINHYINWSNFYTHYDLQGEHQF